MGYISLPNGGLSANPQGVSSIWTPNAQSVGIPGTDPSNSPYDGRQFNWVPLQTTIKTWFLRLTAAPGATKTANYRFHYDSDLNVSTIQQIVNTSTEVSNVIEADVPALDVASDTTIRGTIHYLSGWPSTNGNATSAGYPAIEYAIATNPELAWYLCGTGASLLSSADFGASDQFSGIVDSAIAAAQNTQTPWQIRLPVKGVLKYAFATWRGYTSTTTVEAALQKGTRGGGSDTAIVFTMVGAATTALYQASINSGTTVAVTQGDYLNWRLKRTAGAATTGAILLGVGYAAGL